MNCFPTEIDDVKIIEPQIFSDNRGWLMIPWNSFMLKKLEISSLFVQDTQSFTASKGTIRGLHFQNGDAAQAKLVRVLKGAVLDVAVDLRKGSPHYLKWVAVELSAENRRMLYIPRGFAHGFLTLVDNTEFFYKVDNAYCPESDRTIRFDDPQIGIIWGVNKPLLSDKDRNAPLLKDSDCSFTYSM